jgi:hypothetical protein
VGGLQVAMREIGSQLKRPGDVCGRFTVWCRYKDCDGVGVVRVGNGGVG